MPRKKQRVPEYVEKVSPVQEDRFVVKETSFFEGKRGFFWGGSIFLFIALGIFLFFIIADNIILSSFS